MTTGVVGTGRMVELDVGTTRVVVVGEDPDPWEIAQPIRNAPAATPITTITTTSCLPPTLMLILDPNALQRHQFYVSAIDDEDARRLEARTG